MKIILALFLFPFLAHADEITFRCHPLTQPMQQGDELWFQIALKPDSNSAILKVGNGANNYTNLVEGLPTTGVGYTDIDIHAFARWGKEVTLSMMFFSTHWIANIHFEKERRLPFITFPAGFDQEIDCHDTRSQE